MTRTPASQSLGSQKDKRVWRELRPASPLTPAEHAHTWLLVASLAWELSGSGAPLVSCALLKAGWAAGSVSETLLGAGTPRPHQPWGACRAGVWQFEGLAVWLSRAAPLPHHLSSRLAYHRLSSGGVSSPSSSLSNEPVLGRVTRQGLFPLLGWVPWCRIWFISVSCQAPKPIPPHPTGPQDP